MQCAHLKHTHIQTIILYFSLFQCYPERLGSRPPHCFDPLHCVLRILLNLISMGIYGEARLSVQFCGLGSVYMCFRFMLQRSINKLSPNSWGLASGWSEVITDNLIIIITTINSKAEQACDIWMADITGSLDYINDGKNRWGNVLHAFSLI